MDHETFKAFIISVREGKVDAVESILQHHPEWIDERGIYGWIPLHLAAYYGQNTMIELLVRLGSRALHVIDVAGKTPLHRAVIGCHCSTVALLIRLGLPSLNPLDNGGVTPLNFAITGGHDDIAALLRSFGC